MWETHLWMPVSCFEGRVWVKIQVWMEVFEDPSVDGSRRGSSKCGWRWKGSKFEDGSRSRRSQGGKLLVACVV